MSEETLGTTTVTQVAIVVRDIEAKSAAWAGMLGVPVPNIIVTDGYDLARTEYNGEPSHARAKLAFFNLGQVSLELIEPIDGPSTWLDQLNGHGESLHHIAFGVKGMQERLAFLAGKGAPLIQRGEYTGGRYAYVDSTEQFGAVIELLEND